MTAPFLRIRPAVAEDEQILLEWRNDPLTRKAAIEQGWIDPADHSQWLKRKLEDPSCTILIGEVSGAPVGQVRFDLGREGAEVDLAIASERRGQGFGGALLRRGCEAMGACRFVAVIRPENQASLSVFTKNGFRRTGFVARGGVELVVMQTEPGDGGA